MFTRPGTSFCSFCFRLRWLELLRFVHLPWADRPKWLRDGELGLSKASKWLNSRTECSIYHHISTLYICIYIYIWYDMIWYDMIWYDMIWYDMIWYDMIWYDMIWYDMWYMIYDIWYMIYDIWYMIYDMICIYACTMCTEFLNFHVHQINWSTCHMLIYVDH